MAICWLSWREEGDGQGVAINQPTTGITTIWPTSVIFLTKPSSPSFSLRFTASCFLVSLSLFLSPSSFSRCLFILLCQYHSLSTSVTVSLFSFVSLPPYFLAALSFYSCHLLSLFPSLAFSVYYWVTLFPFLSPFLSFPSSHCFHVFLLHSLYISVTFSPSSFSRCLCALLYQYKSIQLSYCLPHCLAFLSAWVFIFGCRFYSPLVWLLSSFLLCFLCMCVCPWVSASVCLYVCFCPSVRLPVCLPVSVSSICDGSYKPAIELSASQWYQRSTANTPCLSLFLFILLFL